MSKVKVKQETLFPDQPKPKRDGVCCICKRSILKGVIGGGCYRKIMATIKFHQNEIKKYRDALHDVLVEGKWNL